MQWSMVYTTNRKSDVQTVLMLLSTVFSVQSLTHFNDNSLVGHLVCS